MTNERDLLNNAFRQDFTSFIHKSVMTISPATVYMPNWHIEVMAWHLEQCLRGNIRRLIITLPPRNLKSICTSVCFPAWALGHNPTLRIINATYSPELSASFSRQSRIIMEIGWYRGAFPATRLDPTKNNETEMATTAQGFRLGSSVGGPLTGRGAGFLIVDDPLKASDASSAIKRQAANDWYDETLISRLDNKETGCIIVVMHRLHPEDLVGHLLKKDNGWVHLNLPAIADVSERFEIGDGRIFIRKPGDLLHPERESAETLERINRDMGSVPFNAQYLQSPMTKEGQIIKWHWFSFHNFPPIPEWQEGNMIVQSWDTASKATDQSDWSVCTTWLRRNNCHYLIDVYRDRIDFPTLIRVVEELEDRYRPDAVLIEDKGSGTQLIQLLQERGSVRPIGITPVGSKIERMEVNTPALESKSVLLPEKAPWLDDLKTELLQFPNGRHDDQVDSISQYLNWAHENRPIRGEVIGILTETGEKINNGEWIW